MAEPVRFQHFEVPIREDGSLHELGRGAMGITYKAFDTNLRCFVALKVVNSAYLGSEVSRQRFLREARAAAALRHPNVAAVFHLGEEAGEYFYAMEYVDGETVEAMMKRDGAIPAAIALNIVLQVSRALGAAHKQGLVHRDIKPSNLMIVREDDGEFTVKVIDFGLAKQAGGSAGDDAATLTLSGFLGTPHFASPEQLEERELDVRSDIYSLGVTLFYMLAGRAPFSGSLAQVMSQHLHRDPPLQTLPDQPPQVLALLGHMLAKDPASRPQTPGDLRREVESCLAAIQSVPLPPPLPVEEQDFETQILPSPVAEKRPPPPSAETRRNLLPVLGAIAVVLLLAGLGAGAFFLFRSRPPAVLPQPTPPPATAASATPSPTPLPEPTPDPVFTAISNARATAQSDPAAALTSLIDLQKSHPDRPEARDAVGEFLHATRERRESLSPGQIAALRKPLEAAAALDFLDAQMLLGEELRESDPGDALQWTLAAAKSGDTDAMLQAGLMLSNDMGPHKKNPQDAAKWFQSAAEHGNPHAMLALGECYQLGKGVAPDMKLALDWITRAADQNEVNALNRLGGIYANGIPGIVPPDLTKAFALFSTAKDLGYADAYGNLGLLFLTAPGMKDEKMAVEIFRQGIEKGDGRSMCYYASAIEGGLGGLGVDRVAAQDLYVKAAELGVMKAQDWCRKHHVPFTPPH